MISVIEILLHPRRTARCLDDAVRRAEDAERRLSEQRERTAVELAGRDRRLEEARVVVETLTAEKTVLEARVATLEAENEELNQKMAEVEDEDARFDELFKRLEEFEVVKAKYEDRIKRLKLHLHDARDALKTLRQPDFADQPRSISMTETVRPETDPAPKPAAQRPAKKEAPLPKVLPPRHPKPKPAVTLPPEKPSDSDWLQQLPDF